MRKTWALALAAALLALPGCGRRSNMGTGGADSAGGYPSSDTGSYAGEYAGGGYPSSDTGSYAGEYANGGYPGTGGYAGNYADGTYGDSAYSDGSMMDRAGDAMRRGAEDVRDGLDRAGDALRDAMDGKDSAAL